MTKVYLSVVALFVTATMAMGQFTFDPTINPDFNPATVKFPASPLNYQVLFVGGVDQVQTLDANGQPNGSTPAKEWHDFIGVTYDDQNPGEYWITVNHEMIQANDKIGDGGGMTAFKVRQMGDSLMVLDQTLTDGRQGKFFNVDFVNTVGETGMNCGGIVGPDGRIWTAEEWFRTSTNSIYAGGAGIRDTADFTIASDIVGNFDGQTIKKYENLNWLVEIDPREAKAIRKQYNWGRSGYEGGAILDDNKTVYLGHDGTPGFMTKFVADVAGDFTSGKTYVYKHDAPTKWVEIDNTDLTKMLNFIDEAVAAGATMFNRLEWVAFDPHNNQVLFTETGRDNPAGAWRGESGLGAVHAPHHLMRAAQQGTHPDSSAYWDYYGRVIALDLATDEVSIFLEGGPYYAADSVNSSVYPDVHLSNPDGLTFWKVNDKPFLIIQEDLNGTSHGRVPADLTTNRTCEAYMLDLSIANPTLDDLVRIAVVPMGAEITGAWGTPDGKTLLINCQHPSSNNPFPYNHSLTFAITGWDQAVTTGLFNQPAFEEGDDFKMFPNPVSRELRFERPMDVALYNIQGQRINVFRNTDRIDVSQMVPGVYFVRNMEGKTKKLIIER